MERLLSSILELIEASEVPENVQITFITFITTNFFKMFTRREFSDEIWITNHM